VIGQNGSSLTEEASSRPADCSPSGFYAHRCIKFARSVDCYANDIKEFVESSSAPDIFAVPRCTSSYWIIRWIPVPSDRSSAERGFPDLKIEVWNFMMTDDASLAELATGVALDS
jgi:hypothetical protein